MELYLVNENLSQAFFPACFKKLMFRYEFLNNPVNKETQKGERMNLRVEGGRSWLSYTGR